MATPTSSSATTKPRRACFSFAAYVKNVIEHLKSRGVPVLEGLTDREFSSIQSTFNFVFPPDLRSILSEGLPVGPGFPNWRSSSPHHLRLLLDLPLLGLSKDISTGRFWCRSWGDRPHADPEDNLAAAKPFLTNAPILVPIYGHCYIPSTPCSAGNPVFFVRRGDIRYSGYDVAGFFQQAEFRGRRAFFRPAHAAWAAAAVNAPVWAAKAARRIEVWSELVEGGRWEESTCEGRVRHVLGDCFDEMSWILRDGGWEDGEVEEMMDTKRRTVVRVAGDRDDRERVTSHVREMSVVMLRGGWSVEDVVYSLGIDERVVHREIESS